VPIRSDGAGVGRARADAGDEERVGVALRHADQIDQPPVVEVVRVLSIRSHRTKYASSGRLPISPPLREGTSRRSPIDCRMEVHSRSLLGSKTAHWVVGAIEGSR
jgi:hypothetical protein